MYPENFTLLLPDNIKNGDVIPVPPNSPLHRFFPAVLATSGDLSEGRITSPMLSSQNGSAEDQTREEVLASKFDSFLINPSVASRRPEVCTSVIISNVGEELSETMPKFNKLNSGSKSDLSSSQSEQSSLSTVGDASSTRDCSTTEFEEAAKKEVGIKSMAVKQPLKGCRGVLCLGTSKVASIQKEVEQKRTLQERDVSPYLTESLTPTRQPIYQSNARKIQRTKRGTMSFSAPSPHKNQAQNTNAPVTTTSRQYSFPPMGFAGPRFKASPSPLSVPIPVFDTSD
eukprot:Gregarina_sp_Poly_1__4236@NODE_230_length_11113_cov_80_669654_g54_i1_p4_GENE_NODE_230_length_11113_cov_80_669654_g54_i1NODE_230_length_11113_cov_80_669654_g54_i1_p4_ORF_typecomplete_len285_score37_58PNRC/PF15365_6/1_8e04PNRC/PF15365_6/0_031_NODE_230_length_11113_cov_80_669654_g54_i1972010574